MYEKVEIIQFDLTVESESSVQKVLSQKINKFLKDERATIVQVLNPQDVTATVVYGTTWYVDILVMFKWQIDEVINGS